MRFRLLALTLILSLGLFACKSTPSTSTTGSDTNARADNNANNSSAPAADNMQAAEKPRPEPPRAIVIPAGTTLTVRLDQAVGSKISHAGDSFSATLSSPVAVDGRTAIRTGARASGTVVDAKPLGRFAGGASLELQLTSIAVDGRDRAIETAAVSRVEKGKGKRTGIMAGGGAALGALIGGLSGGGKGAAIGAVAGGGAGGAGAAFTGNKDIVLPVETALNFKLTNSLEVR
ncbi:MAG: hypothetical protein JWO91_1986 [Acidobacteriaceae bacterium]|jgi:hypothetical protein|nr:hypothetical protein [Acidobacteriaceae bacterium]